MRTAAIAAAVLLLVCETAVPGAPKPLPNGDEGIAAKYLDDEGIEKDPAVLLHDDFEDVSKPDDLTKTWDAGVWHRERIRVAEEPANVHAGRRALEFTIPKQPDELANTVARRLADEKDVLFLRYYTKFEKGFDPIGSSHNGCTISAHYEKDGRSTPGVPADGTNKFLVCLENWRGEESTTSPGGWNCYVYHPGQADRFGDHFFPSGTVLPNSYARSGAATFGKDFVARTDVIPELDRWVCCELMVRANTVGERDGRIAFWLDGRLAADFPGLRFRDVKTLAIDRFSLNLHIGQNPRRENKKWYDDVVAATSYIGPMKAKRR